VTIDSNRAAILSANATSVTATTPSGSVGVKSLTVTTAGGTVTKVNAFSYVATLDGGSSGMPTSGAPSGKYAPPSSIASEGDSFLPVATMDHCVALILQSTSTPSDCRGVTCDNLQQMSLDPVADGPDGPDLDGNAVPDLCQLRCGDLDMNGVVDLGDLAILLAMLGEEPVLGIGDFDANGQIDADDLAEVVQRIQASDRVNDPMTREAED